MTEVKKEGFWYSEDELDFPDPIIYEGAWDRGIFLSSLIRLEEELESRYQVAVSAYNSGDSETYKKYNQEYEKEVVSYRGSSFCRICDCSNGYREFQYGGFVWPHGYRHYIEEHGIKPSDCFIKMVRGSI